MSLAIKLEGTIWGQTFLILSAIQNPLNWMNIIPIKVFMRNLGNYRPYFKASYTGGYDKITLVIDEIKPPQPRDPNTQPSNI